MGRDRDPFERALEAIRLKLRVGDGLQGRALAINLLAKDLGVSQTPVREALAWLAGEGLIVRTRAGYVGRTHDVTSLAELYRLNLAHVVAALSAESRGVSTRGNGRRRPASWPLTEGDDPNQVFDVVVAQAGDRTLLAALRRTRETLSVFIPAEASVIGDADEVMSTLGQFYPDPSRVRAVARAFYRRRIQGAAQLLEVTLERLRI